MNETSATALLVGGPEAFVPRENAVATTVPRSEIEGAIRMDPPADLVLEVLRPSESGDWETRTLNVTWRRADLETVLASTEDERITFSFDGEELERALDPDVEGHGLREAAAVLTIAAAAAAGTAAAASAEPGGGVYTPAQVAIAGHDEAGTTERGIGVTGGTAHDEATAAERGIEATQATVHDESTLAARGIEPGYVPATHDEGTLVTRGIDTGPLAAVHDEASLQARGIEPGSIAVHDEAGLVQRGVTPSPTPVAGTGGFEMPSVDPGTVAGIAGGLAGAGLIIAAAAFATRRREPRPV